MADLGSLLAAGVFVAFAVHRAMTIRRGAGPAQRYIAGFAACMGTAMLFRAPVMASALHSLRPLDAVAALATHELKTCAQAMLLFVALSLKPSRPDRRSVRRQVLLAFAVLVVGAAALLAAGARAESGPAAAPVGQRWILASYNVVFATYGSWCLLVLVRELCRQAGQLTPGPLRTGLRLMMLAGLVGTAWTLWVLTYIPTNLAQGLQAPSEDAVCSALGAVTAILATGGATATWWAPFPEGPLGAPGRWLFAYRANRALEPLWSALRTELPQIAFDASAATRRPAPWRAEFALYRRVIEIRDGHLALRPYVPTDVAAWAAEAADRSADRRAVLEAATIAAALESKRAGHRQGGPHSVGPAPERIAGTIAAEAAWLLKVATAFTSSSTVAAVRARARATCDSAA
ncbi:MAB_1171c family putative transporter [Streptomyces sp. NPDC001480]|uniref:MAB_1171c family putative transporter n=1 Tax=Streptomyces sp. NPDC001480 TaxID=3364577 RepID=UPI00367B0F13